MSLDLSVLPSGPTLTSFPSLSNVKGMRSDSLGVLRQGLPCDGSDKYIVHMLKLPLSGNLQNSVNFISEWVW